MDQRISVYHFDGGREGQDVLLLSPHCLAGGKGQTGPDPLSLREQAVLHGIREGRGYPGKGREKGLELVLHKHPVLGEKTL